MHGIGVQKAFLTHTESKNLKVTGTLENIIMLNCRKINFICKMQKPRDCERYYCTESRRQVTPRACMRKLPVINTKVSLTSKEPIKNMMTGNSKPLRTTWQVT